MNRRNWLRKKLADWYLIPPCFEVLIYTVLSKARFIFGAAHVSFFFTRCDVKTGKNVGFWQYRTKTTWNSSAGTASDLGWRIVRLGGAFLTYEARGNVKMVKVSGFVTAFIFP